MPWVQIDPLGIRGLKNKVNLDPGVIQRSIDGRLLLTISSLGEPNLIIIEIQQS